MAGEFTGTNVPSTVGRREAIKKALKAAALVAGGGAAVIAAEEIFGPRVFQKKYEDATQWDQTRDVIFHDPFFGKVDAFQGNPLVGRPLTYSANEIANHGSLIVGDSLSVGYEEGTTTTYPPELLLQKAAQNGPLLQRLQAHNPSVQDINWYSLSYGTVGTTLGDMAPQ